MGKILLIGGGGHARVLIDLIRSLGKYEIVGILDPQLEKGSAVLGVSVLGGDRVLKGLYDQKAKNACIGIGSVNSNEKRRSLYERVSEIGFRVPELIHPKSIVSNESKIAGGVQVMAGAIIQANTFIDQNTIINTGAVVDHDCIVGKHVHICPGAVISGGCIIGDGAFIGVGSMVIQGVKIGKGTLIAAGSVVLKNVPDGATVKGVPAK